MSQEGALRSVVEWVAVVARLHWQGRQDLHHILRLSPAHPQDRRSSAAVQRRLRQLSPSHWQRARPRHRTFTVLPCLWDVYVAVFPWLLTVCPCCLSGSCMHESSTTSSSMLYFRTLKVVGIESTGSGKLSMRPGALRRKRQRQEQHKRASGRTCASVRLVLCSA